MKKFNVTIELYKTMEVSVAANNAEEAVGVATELCLLGELDGIDEEILGLRASAVGKNEAGQYVESSVFARERNGVMDVHPIFSKPLSAEECIDFDNDNDFDDEDDDEEDEKKFELKEKLKKILLDHCKRCEYFNECKRKEQLE